MPLDLREDGEVWAIHRRRGWNERRGRRDVNMEETAGEGVENQVCFFILSLELCSTSAPACGARSSSSATGRI